MSVLEDIASVRTSVREFVGMNEQGQWLGLCSVVALLLSLRSGWLLRRGCYVLLDDSHMAHAWNLLPNGLIIDSTADQFGEPDPGIRMLPEGDPRYIADCRCPMAGRDWL